VTSLSVAGNGLGRSLTLLVQYLLLAIVLLTAPLFGVPVLTVVRLVLLVHDPSTINSQKNFCVRGIILPEFANNIFKSPAGCSVGESKNPVQGDRTSPLGKIGQ
jgi:hypothetical protein